MAGRKIAGGIRSGRFKAPADGQKIVVVSKEASYRVFNTGKPDFDVVVTDSMSGDKTTVGPVERHSSIDLNVPDASFVSIALHPDNFGVIQGVYDLLDSSTPSRTGRIRVKDSKTTPVLVVKGQKNILYRFISTDDKRFMIKAGATEPYSVSPDCALDLYLPGQRILVSGEDDAPISGIYERLNPDSSGPSGRFTFDAVHEPLEHTIVDLTSMPGSSGTHCYRITNGGDNRVTVKRGSELYELSVDQSVDLQIAVVDSPALKKITVQGDPDKSFTGIYDYLGIVK